MKRLSILACISILIMLSGCASSIATAKHHNIDKLPSSFVYIPVEIEVSKFGVGNVTEIPEWSAEAKSLVSREIKNYVDKNLQLASVNLEAVGSQDSDVLDEYIGLYDATAGAAIQSQTAGVGWEHKKANFDYTLGPGVSFLKEHTDAETALFVVGQNYVSTGGRKLTFLFAAAFGVAIPLGHSFLHVGFIDINTGNLLWTNSVYSQSLNLRDQQNVSNIVATLFESYPK